MKTIITVTTLCAVLYAGINTFKNTTSEINQHNTQLENAIAMERTK